jgi:MHS family proline/betaine transporter-like MFS transporter
MVIFVGDGEFIKPAVPHAFAINSLSLTFLMIWFPLAGSLSDKFSRLSVMSIGGLGMAVFGPIAVFVIATQQTVAAVLGSQLILGVAISMWGAPMCAWLVESFDPAARLTSVSIGYNIAQAVAGGLSPLVATILADEVSLTAPGIIFFGLAVLALCGLWFVSPVGNIFQYWHSSSPTTAVVENGTDEIQAADDTHSLELQEIS